MPVLDGLNKSCSQERTDAVSSLDISKEVDELVNRISQTLQLKAQQKLRVKRVKSVRKAFHPYEIPNEQAVHKMERTRCSPNRECSTTNSTFRDNLTVRCRRSIKYDTKYPTDPHELLRSLLREGSLVKEAVQRLKDRQPHSSKVSVSEETELRFR